MRDSKIGDSARSRGWFRRLNFADAPFSGFIWGVGLLMVTYQLGWVVLIWSLAGLNWRWDEAGTLLLRLLPLWGWVVIFFGAINALTLSYSAQLQRNFPTLSDDSRALLTLSALLLPPWGVVLTLGVTGWRERCFSSLCWCAAAGAALATGVLVLDGFGKNHPYAFYWLINLAMLMAIFAAAALGRRTAERFRWRAVLPLAAVLLIFGGGAAANLAVQWQIFQERTRLEKYLRFDLTRAAFLEYDAQGRPLDATYGKWHGFLKTPLRRFDRRQSFFSDAGVFTPTPEKVDYWRNYFQTHRGDMATLDAIAKRRSFRFKHDPPSEDMPLHRFSLPELTIWRILAMHTRTRLLLGVLDGDRAEIRAAAHNLRKLVSFCGENRLPDAQRTMAAIAQMRLQALSYALTSPALTAADLQTWQAELAEDRHTVKRHFHHGSAGSMLLFADTMEYLTDHPELTFALTLPRIPPKVPQQWRAMATVLATPLLPVWFRFNTAANFTHHAERLSRALTPEAAADGREGKFPDHALLARWQNADYQVLQRQFQMLADDLALAELAVAAERYRRDHGGSAPRKLHALVPQYLARLPASVSDSSAPQLHEGALRISLLWEQFSFTGMRVYFKRKTLSKYQDWGFLIHNPLPWPPPGAATEERR